MSNAHNHAATSYALPWFTERADPICVAPKRPASDVITLTPHAMLGLVNFSKFGSEPAHPGAWAPYRYHPGGAVARMGAGKMRRGWRSATWGTPGSTSSPMATSAAKAIRTVYDRLIGVDLNNPAGAGARAALSWCAHRGPDPPATTHLQKTRARRFTPALLGGRRRLALCRPRCGPA